MKNKKAFGIFLLLLAFLVVIIEFFPKNNENVSRGKATLKDKNFNIIASQENEALEEIIKNYAKTKGYNINFEYAGTLDIIQILNKESFNYDAVWLSNSIWGYMLNSNVNLTNSKCTSINPVIFGIKKSKANELGFIEKTIYTKDIVDAISNKKLKFSMSNPTTTNSGASGYLGLLSTLAGNPEVLTSKMLENENLKQEIKTLFSGLERSSGSEDFLEELFLKGNYEAVVAYESSIININKQLISNGKEPLYAIYPVDGVSISDAPFGYIDNKNSSKKEIFEDLQKYILGNDGQKLLEKKGKRTWYGGISSNVDESIFNKDWGIDTTKYISPVKYPSKEVIKQALNLYQNELRKPVHVAFCLDYSGSMEGTGIKELQNAMQYILTEEAANDFIQFSNRDKIDIIPFSNNVQDVWNTDNGTDTEILLNKIKSNKVSGSTALYPAAIKALEILRNEDSEEYNTSIVLMTDGHGNVGSFKELETYFNRIDKKAPIYSIMFGSAEIEQLQEIANLSNGKVFDGKEDLVEAFKEVRGYN